MTTLAELIAPDCIGCGIQVNSKKRALEVVGELLAAGQPGLNARDVFDGLLARERLGSTGLGHGVAIPHGRMKQLLKARGAFLQLVHGVDFDAIDSKPVDLIFALLVPEKATEEHLQILAALAERLSDPDLRARLHTAATQSELHALLTAPLLPLSING